MYKRQLLFMLFLSARFAVVHLGKIAFHGLQLPDTLFICPVLVVKGVLLGGKPVSYTHLDVYKRQE